jgi:hypothetical protein
MLCNLSWLDFVLLIFSCSWALICIVLLLTEAMVFAPGTMSNGKQVFFALLMVFLFFGTLFLSLSRTLYVCYLARKGKKIGKATTGKDGEEVVWAQNPIQFLAKLGGEGIGEDEGNPSPPPPGPEDVPVPRTTASGVTQVEIPIMSPVAGMIPPAKPSIDAKNADV